MLFISPPPGTLGALVLQLTFGMLNTAAIDDSSSIFVGPAAALVGAIRLEYADLVRIAGDSQRLVGSAGDSDDLVRIAGDSQQMVGSAGDK